MVKPTVRDGREPVLMRITYTSTGTPVDDPKVLAEMGATPSPDPGWFWRTATPASAARIRHHGHRAVGTLTTSYAPFQIGAPLERGMSTCADYNHGVAHAPHRLPAVTRALVCQGVADEAAESAQVTEYDAFCHCPDPLLAADGECLACGTRWVTA